MSTPFIFRYGSYTHEAGEVAPKALNRQCVWDAAGNLLGMNIHWELEGRIHADTPQALTAALEALERAYSIQAQDAGFWLDASTPSAHVLRSAEYLGGVRVVDPISYIEGPGEYTTYRTYRIVLEATTDPQPASGTGNSEATFAQGYTFTGGGAVYVWLLARNAAPQKQCVTEQTTYQAVQEGYLVGNYGQPGYAPPRWPNLEHRERRRIVYDPPKAVGKSGRYRTSWHYEFESDKPFIP